MTIYHCRSFLTKIMIIIIHFLSNSGGIDAEAVEREALERHQAELKVRAELRKKRQKLLYSSRVRDVMPYVELNSGHIMPLIGLGTWKSDPSKAKTKNPKFSEIKMSVECAIKSGYRHIDCAENYQNEGEVGDALSNVFSHEVVKRQDLFNG